MEKDTMSAQNPLHDEEETDSIVSEEADGEAVNQAPSPPLTCTPESTASSIFAAHTIDIRLQIQPEDGHPDGRRIRNVIAVNGKTLRIGALRTNQLNVLIALLRDLDANQVMERFAQFMVLLSERQVVNTHKAGTSAMQPVIPSVHSSPVASVQAPSLEAAPTPMKEEMPKEPEQREPSHVTTASGSISTTPTISRPMVLAGTQEKEAATPEKKPEQLALF